MFFRKRPTRKMSPGYFVTIVLVLLLLLAPAAYTLLSKINGANATIVPIANWKFDEGYGTSTAESISNTNTGTLAGATLPTWQTEDQCIAGKCLYFDGSTSKVTIASTASFKSVSMWVRPISISSGALADFGSNVRITVSSGTLSATGFTTPTIYVDGRESTTLVANRWQHVTVTTGTTVSGSSMQFGTYSTTYLNGYLDEIRMYTDQQTATVVKGDYTARNSERTVAAQFGQASSEFLNQGLIGYWKLDASSSDAADSSGNNTTLTNNGTTTFVGGKFGNGSEHVPASTQYFSTASTVSGVKTVSFWVNPDVTTNYYISLTSSADITSSTGTLSATGFTSPTIYVNGTQGTTITANVWSLVTVTTDTAINANQLYLGRQSTNYFDGTLDEVRLYSRVLSPAEIAQLYDWAPGPTGYWKMDENTGTTSSYDSSGNASTMTINGTMVTSDWQNGKYGSALHFDGSDDYLSAGDLALYEYDATQSFSISAWVFHDDTGSANERIVSKRPSGADPQQGYHLLITTGNLLQASIDDGTNTVNINQSTGTVTTGTWHHVEAVFDRYAQTGYIYVDSNLVGSGSISTVTGSTANASEFRIGRSGTTTGPFDGLIDDVRIYKYARSQQQITIDMNADHPIGGSPVGSQLAYWRFDDPQSTTAYDSINNNDLTLGYSVTNSPKWQTKTTCKINGCLFFTRTNSEAVGVASSSLTGMSTLTTGTISFWANVSNNNANNTLFSLSYNPTVNETYLLVDYDTRSSGGNNIHLKLLADDVTQWEATVSSADFSAITKAAAWHHFAITHNGTTAKIFIDGIEYTLTYSVSTDKTKWFKAIMTDTTNDVESLVIGSYLNNNTVFNATDGYIDEVKIYNAPLTREQILLDMNANASANIGATTNDASSFTDGAGNAPIRYFPLDENTGTTTSYDHSPSSIDATLVSMTSSSWVKGKVGTGLDLDGTADTFYTTTPTNINTTGDSKGTIELWVRPGWASTTTGTSRAFAGMSNGTTEAFGMFFCGSDINCASSGIGTAGDLMITAFDAGVVQNKISLSSANYSWSANEWVHLTFTWDDTASDAKELEIYVNGVKPTQTISTAGALDVSVIAAQTNWYFGEDNGAGTTFFDGVMDEIKIYDYQRTPAQIRYDMNRGAPSAIYKMDECTGTTLYNSAVNAAGVTAGSNGTWTGAGGGNTAAGTCSSGTGTEAWNNGTTGKRNASLDFDGSDDVVTVTNASVIDLNENLQHFTMSAWINPDGAGEGTGGQIFYKGANTWLRVDTLASGKLDLEGSLDLATTDATVNATAAVLQSGWNHIAMSYTDDADDEITLWVNGVAVATSTNGVGSPAADTNNVLIGGTTTNNFDGRIDDVRIFSYELSSTQLKAVMNEGAVRFGPDTGSPL